MFRTGQAAKKVASIGKFVSMATVGTEKGRWHRSRKTVGTKKGRWAQGPLS
jgi:hypothetical protein